VCSACSVVEFSAGNWGQSLGFGEPRKPRNTRKKKALVSVCSACSVVPFLAGNWGQSLGLETLELGDR